MAFDDYDAALGYTQGFEWDANLLSQVAEITVGKQEVDAIDIKHTLPDGKVVWKKMPGPPKPGEVTIKIHMSDKLKPQPQGRHRVVQGERTAAGSPPSCRVCVALLLPSRSLPRRSWVAGGGAGQGR